MSELIYAESTDKVLGGDTSKATAVSYVLNAVVDTISLQVRAVIMTIMALKEWVTVFLHDGRIRITGCGHILGTNFDGFTVVRA